VEPGDEDEESGTEKPGLGNREPGTGKGKKKKKAEDDKESEDFTGHDFRVPSPDTYPDQSAIDAAIATLPAEALQEQMRKVLLPIVKSWQESQDPDQARNELLNAFPQMDAVAVEEMLARVIFIGDVWGRLNA